MKDPYLIPGQPCEVTIGYVGEEPYKQVWYFLDWWTGDGSCEWKGDAMPRFIQKQGAPPGRAKIDIFEKYCPIGTEWDFAQDWAVCSVVQENGMIVFFDTLNPEPITSHCKTAGRWKPFSGIPYDTGYLYLDMRCGICPDKTRYQGEAWETSLRMRPDWAVVGEDK